MKNILLIFISSTLLFSCTTIQKSQKHHNTINDVLTENLELAYQKDEIKGFSVSIVNDKGLIYDKGLGFVDIEQTIYIQYNSKYSFDIQNTYRNFITQSSRIGKTKS